MTTSKSRSWFERVGPGKLLEEVGVNKALVETEIPHPTSLYPNVREHFARVLSVGDEASRRRVLHDNAVALYGFRLPAASTAS